MRQVKKHINKIVLGLLVAAISTVAASVVKVERLEVDVEAVKKEMNGNEKAHERIEKKVDFIIEKLLDNRNI